jgi:phospholipase A2
MMQRKFFVISCVILSLHVGQAKPFVNPLKGIATKTKNALSSAVHKATGVVSTIKNTVTTVVENGKQSSQVAMNHFQGGVVPESPYKAISASVRVDDSSLSNDERLARSARKTVVDLAWQKFHAGGDTPTVALSISGGGYRAMVSTIGILKGLEQAKLMDALTYVAVLSGSSWAVVPWVYWQKSQYGDIGSYSDYVKGKIQDDLRKPSLVSIQAISQYLKARTDANRPVTIIDMWGLLIANKLLARWPKPFELYLADTSDFIKSGRFPIPIMTAINGSMLGGSYEWFEFTPFEVGSSNYYKAFVPSYAAGRTFQGGHQKTSVAPFGPPMSLDFMLGICGSAFAISAGDVWGALSSSLTDFITKQSAREKVSLPESIIQLGRELAGQTFASAKQEMYKKRIIPGGVIWNPAFGMSSSVIPKVAQDLQYLEFVDAGMGGNLPYAPLARPERAVDVVIMCDASATIKGVEALRAAYDYSNQARLSTTYEYTNRPGGKYPFPEISEADFKNAEGASFSIFKGDRSRGIPTIIYIPWFKTGSFDPDPAVSKAYGTMNFKYTSDEFEALSGYWQANIVALKDAIVSAIREHML